MRELPTCIAGDGSRSLKTLSEADPAMPTWTWSSDQTAGFVIRRMTQETAIHLWDATDAAGMVDPIDPALASDGIDEFLTYFIADVVEGAEPVGGSVHIHCGDVPGEWTVRETVGGFDVVREHSKGDSRDPWSGRRHPVGAVASAAAVDVRHRRRRRRGCSVRRSFQSQLATGES